MSLLSLSYPSLIRTEKHVSLSARLGEVCEMTIAVNGHEDLLDQLTPSLLPFIPIAILIAAKNNRPLLIDAALDDTWWASLICGYCPLVQRLFDFEEIQIHRRGSGSTTSPIAGDIALMFSSGVDSFYSLGKLIDLGVRPNWLVNINAGAHDSDRDCWAQRIKGFENVAAEVGARTITIDTNFHEVFPADHVRSHLIRNISSAFILHPCISSIFYSSAHQFEDISFASAMKYGIDYIDHSALATFVPRQISVNVLGWDADRITKTRVISENPVAHIFLDVCTNQGYQGSRLEYQPLNCGFCPKCARTMLTLEHFGKLIKFKSQFNLSEFYARRPELVSMLKAQKHPVDCAVSALIEDEN